MTGMRLCLGLGLGLSLVLALPAQAQDIPFAEQPYREGGHREPMLLTLADLMALAQDRHTKLWRAGKANHFALVTYEANKLADSLYRAASLYANIPVALVRSADEALMRMSSAAEKRNGNEVQTAFRELTHACNACHQAAGIDFVKIKTPTSSGFTNQDFAPAD